MPGLTLPRPAWGGDATLLALRVAAALLYLAHGVQKVLEFPAPSTWPAPPFSLLWFSGQLELGLGLQMLLGLGCRPAAFIAAGHMAAAYFIAHAARGFYPVLNGGDAAILFSFVFLYFAAVGAGPWSLDAAWSHHRARGRAVSEAA